jgi:alkyl hydroperoxide reductase subunit AhpF
VASLLASSVEDRRAENLARLKSESWDVLIVGGGINGAGTISRPAPAARIRS